MSNLLDLRINKEGNSSQSLVSIKIPRICCGYNTSIIYSFIPEVPDQLFTGCLNHMSSPVEIWKNFVIDKIHITEFPLRCIRCNNINEYATKEYCQKDGTYICRSCVSYLYWDCEVPEEPPSDNGGIPPITLIGLRGLI